MPTLRYVFGELEFGAVCYVMRPELANSAARMKRGRRYKDADGLFLSWHDYEGTRVKCWENFPHHLNVESMGTFLTECHAVGVKAPSSYSNIAHRLFPYPKVPRAFSHPFGPYFVGGWQEAFTTGRVKRPLVSYDIRSAYAAAMAQPLPDPDSYRFVRGKVRGPGLYIVTGTVMAPRVPLPLSPGRRCTAALLPEEIDLYRLADVEVHYGLTWRWSKRWTDALWALADQVPAARKPVLASAWAQTAGRYIECEMVPKRRKKKKWLLQNPHYNLPWAFAVVHRVHQQVFEHVDAAHHVFVDSVITAESNHSPRLGEGPGEWKRIGTYPTGLTFEGPGIYRRPGGGYVKRAGVPVPRPAMQTGALELPI